MLLEQGRVYSVKEQTFLDFSNMALSCKTNFSFLGRRALGGLEDGFVGQVLATQV